MDLKNQNRTSQSRRSYRTSGSRWVRYPETGLVLMAEPRIANHEVGLAPKCGRSKGLLLHQWRQGELFRASFSIQADQTERRGLFEFSVGVCTRDCLSSIKALLETQASHAHASSEALHVPSGSCRYQRRSNTDDSSFDLWHTYTLLEFVIEISNLKIFCSTPPPVSSCCVISDQPRSSLPVNQTSAISVRDTTELPN